MANLSHLHDLRAIVTELRASVADLVALDEHSPRTEQSDEQTRQTYDAARLTASLDVRSALFGANSSLFGDPAWTILLELYVARKGGRRLSVSDVANSSRAPVTTGLRHIAMLEQQGLVRREGDARDARRTFVFLTDDTAERISEWLSCL